MITEIYIVQKETQTIITSESFTASFWHCELLLALDLSILLDEANAREYANFIQVAADELRRFKAEKDE